MYYPYFIIYMLMGLVLSLFVFFWALNNGQFKDQKRARFLPLRDDGEKRPARASRVSRIELYALACLVCAGLMASAAVVVFALIRVNGS